ncbi:glycosyltransferase [Flavobacterium cupreum]|uniref:Glycosyltransferase n=1 Tax=Flavobacterium cupreum TaxID=2133766 RepID=A0A434A7P6_9FLAO|nr:glycosyltransferase [Flavobacterium cupreum]RUT70367.1 glycosyltransferase [Flavobacterium cupreum]
MRIVQIIDSLEAGGAERMAVNYANILAGKIEFSGLVTTRKEGQLVNLINEKVSYLFLKKEKKIDFKAIFKLRKYLKKNKIDIIHAHSSSFFTAVLVKFTMPGIKIIWHDHYGSRAKESKKQNRILIFASFFFHSVFVVNLQLQEWSRKNMNCKKVIFVPNFLVEQNENPEITQLKGENGKRIVFLANLKKPKNHISILSAFSDLNLKESGWTLHLIGKDYADPYSQELKDFIKSNALENHIHLCGEKSDIKYILSQASVGVLASTQEGFPVTLLEYAAAKLAVVSTNVGYCPELIQDEFNGLLFHPLRDAEIKQQLEKITKTEALREVLASNLHEILVKDYSQETIVEKLIQAYKK